MSFFINRADDFMEEVRMNLSKIICLQNKEQAPYNLRRICENLNIEVNMKTLDDLASEISSNWYIPLSLKKVSEKKYVLQFIDNECEYTPYMNVAIGIGAYLFCEMEINEELFRENIFDILESSKRNRMFQQFLFELLMPSDSVIDKCYEFKDNDTGLIDIQLVSNYFKVIPSFARERLSQLGITRF